MATVREIFVRLGVKTDPRGFQRAEAGISRLTNSAMMLGRLFLTGAVAVGFKRMIDVASDIEETANKFGAVFGKTGSEVQKQLDDIAKRTGATSLQLQEMSSNIGALIKPSLGSAQAAGKMAARVSELALDIASFNNVTSEDALIALRSGLIGSAEPLQRFGVDVRVAALEQEALRQGITQSIQSMTEGQRVALRYAAIQRQLGTQGATGDATRTAEGFANASRNLGQALRETAGVIGIFLLGSVGRMVNSIRGAVDSFQAWLRANRALIQQRIDRFLDRTGRIIRAVVTLVGRVIDATSEWVNSLSPVSSAIIKITAAVAALAAVLLLPGVPLLLLIGLIGLLIEDFETFRKGGDSVIGDMTTGIRGLVDEWGGVGPAIGAMLDTALRHWLQFFGATEDETDDWIQALDETLQTFWTNVFEFWGGQIRDGFAALGETMVEFARGIADSVIGVFMGIGESIRETVVSSLQAFGDLGRAAAARLGIDLAANAGQQTVGPRAVTQQASAAAGTVVNRNQTTTNVTVQAAPGMSEQRLAEMIPKAIREEQERQLRGARRDFAVEAAGG